MVKTDWCKWVNSIAPLFKRADETKASLKAGEGRLGQALGLMNSLNQPVTRQTTRSMLKIFPEQLETLRQAFDPSGRL